MQLAIVEVTQTWDKIVECLLVGKCGNQRCCIVELGVLIDKGRRAGRLNALAAVIEDATTHGEDLENFIAWRCFK